MTKVILFSIHETIYLSKNDNYLSFFEIFNSYAAQGLPPCQKKVNFVSCKICGYFRFYIPNKKKCYTR